MGERERDSSNGVFQLLDPGIHTSLRVTGCSLLIMKYLNREAGTLHTCDKNSTVEQTHPNSSVLQK